MEENEDKILTASQPCLHPPGRSHPQVRTQHLPSMLPREGCRHRFHQGASSTSGAGDEARTNQDYSTVKRRRDGMAEEGRTKGAIGLALLNGGMSQHIRHRRS